LCLSLFSPQVDHYTGSSAYKLLLQQQGYQIFDYPCDRSFVNNEVFGRQFDENRGHVNGPISLPFLSVFNEGTLEMNLLVGDLEEEMRRTLGQCVKLYYQDAKKNSVNKKRGNYQYTIGFAGGQSHKPRTDGHQIIEDFGAARPSERTGKTEMDCFGAHLMLLVSFLAKRIGVPWTNADYQEAHPEIQDRLQRFAEPLGRKADSFLNGTPNLVETVYVLFSILDPDSKVNRHKDNQNCDELPDCVSFGGLVHIPDENK
jgi:hypothetical protein